MLRLHFTAEDLAKVVLVGSALPGVGEAVTGFQSMRRADQGEQFGLWRQGLRGQLPAVVRPLWDLVPADGWVPDFLTPYPGSVLVPAAVEAIRSTPRKRIVADLERLATRHRLPAWANGLARGDQEAVNAVADAVAAYHEVAIAPHADRMQAVQDTERTRAARTMAERGTGAMLESLHPALRWQAPVLAFPAPVDEDIYLTGRGIALAPVLFCGPLPRLQMNDVEQPILAYPLTWDSATVNPLVTPVPSRPHRPSAAVAKVLGSTRATVLYAIAAAPGITTADLAARTRTSLASASEHATTLRQAGLVLAERQGNRVHHHPTATGAALLDAADRSRADGP